MKFSTSMKVLTAAAGLALASHASAATITNDALTGNGDLMFAAWDGSNSYMYDIGVRMDTLLANQNVSQSWTLPSFSLSTGSGTLWSLAAGDYVGSVYKNFRVLISDASNSLQLKGSATKNAALYWGNFFDNANVTPVANGGCAGASPCTTPVLEPGTSNPNINYAGNAGYYGSAIKGSIPTSITSDLASSMNLWLSDSGSNATVVSNAIMTELPGALSVSNASGVYTLNYTVPSAVPVPAAVWLMGSALMGLVGIGRRRRA